LHADGPSPRPARSPCDSPAYPAGRFPRPRNRRPARVVLRISEMSRRAYKTSIAADAVEVVEERHPGGARRRSRYLAGGEVVGLREWDEEGWLDFECGFRGGLKHGYQYRWLSETWLLSREPYRDGKAHGVGKQWGEDGRLLVTWKLVHGV